MAATACLEAAREARTAAVGAGADVETLTEVVLVRTVRRTGVVVAVERAARTAGAGTAAGLGVGTAARRTTAGRITLIRGTGTAGARTGAGRIGGAVVAVGAVAAVAAGPTGRNNGAGMTGTRPVTGLSIRWPDGTGMVTSP
ncbi:hypothetical protein [Deinococcus yunweiensis]|uniref:hypothetical protein n=1 Tax=Deinococcus yunweiensis TaxID=367282 RepID=UPI00398F3834